MNPFHDYDAHYLGESDMNGMSGGGKNNQQMNIYEEDLQNNTESRQKLDELERMALEALDDI